MWKQSYRLTKLFHGPEYKSPLRVAISIKTKLQKFRLSMPIIHVVANPGLKKRHWNSIKNIVGVELTPNESTTLNDILKHSNLIEDNLPKLIELTNLAGKEYSIEQAFKKMKRDWMRVCFTLIPYYSTHILASFEDILSMLDDHLAKTSTMKNSQFIVPFEQEVYMWFDELNRMKKILENITKVQHAWLYLDPIFNSSDLRDQMPNEEKHFSELTQIWSDLIAFLNEDSNAFRLFSKQNLLENLEQAVSLYEKIHLGLGEYLEKKRLFFPRFFFLSNDELLEILSETRDPLRVEPHLKKCFEGIRRLGFTDNKHVEAILSTESEEVKLVEEVIPEHANGLVEIWLHEVELMMKLTLKSETNKAINDYKEMDKFEWISKYPGQIIIATSIIYWTSEVTEALQIENGLKSYLTKTNKLLDEILQIVRANLNKFTSNLRITIEALIVIEVHGIIFNLNYFFLIQIISFYFKLETL